MGGNMRAPWVTASAFLLWILLSGAVWWAVEVRRRAHRQEVTDTRTVIQGGLAGPERDVPEVTAEPAAEHLAASEETANDTARPSPSTRPDLDLDHPELDKLALTAVAG